MTAPVTSETVREWIDDDLVSSVETYPDDAAEFNLTVEISNLVLHVIRRRPDGPVLVGQEIEYDEEIRRRLRQLSQTASSEIVARIRETLTPTPIIYGFHDEQGNNVRFREMQRIFLEQRLYPGKINQHALMGAIVSVWKAMRYVDDIVALLEIAER